MEPAARQTLPGNGMRREAEICRVRETFKLSAEFRIAIWHTVITYHGTAVHNYSVAVLFLVYAFCRSFIDYFLRKFDIDS